MSNFYICNKELNIMKIKDKLHSHFYEPYSKLHLQNKHVYYTDIVKDFAEDINSYGFSPFLHKYSSEQKADPDIMKFKSKAFENGYLNYIRNSNNHKVNKMKPEVVIKEDINIKSSTFLKSAIDKMQKKKSSIQVFTTEATTNGKNMKDVNKGETKVNNDIKNPAIKRRHSSISDNQNYIKDLKKENNLEEIFYRPKQNLIISQAMEKLPFKIPYSNKNDYMFYYGGRKNIKNHQKLKNLKGRCCLYKHITEVE